MPNTLASQVLGEPGCFRPNRGHRDLSSRMIMHIEKKMRFLQLVDSPLYLYKLGSGVKSARRG